MKLHLTEKKCVACEGGVPPLTRDQSETFLAEVPKWKLASDNKSILREFTFKDFKEALVFVDKVGALAESEGHHPDLNLFSFKNVLITLSTQAIGGLSENDFILAAKIDTL